MRNESGMCGFLCEFDSLCVGYFNANCAPRLG